LQEDSSALACRSKSFFWIETFNIDLPVDWLNKELAIKKKMKAPKDQLTFKQIHCPQNVSLLGPRWVLNKSMTPELTKSKCVLWMRILPSLAKSL
jgi:hypothetical protein